MNFWVLAALALALVALRFFKPGVLVGMTAVWVALYLGLKFGVNPPLPASIVGLYMSIITGALALYLSSDSTRLAEFGEALKRFTTERRQLPALVTVLAFLPLFFGFQAWRNSAREIEAPASGRTIHPAPPSEISFRGKRIDLIKDGNPYRQLETVDPEAFAGHLDNGRSVYYRNCVFCHGDNLEGRGLFAHGFDPLPANFQDPTTIAMLQENYLFWRIAKGGPGLPDESTPWSSGMPAWEPILSEADIWDTILFLYSFTGQKPRAQEHHE